MYTHKHHVTHTPSIYTDTCYKRKPKMIGVRIRPSDGAPTIFRIYVNLSMFISYAVMGSTESTTTVAIRFSNVVVGVWLLCIEKMREREKKSGKF